MAYISQTNIEDVYGTENVRVWSNMDSESETTDTARVARMIAIAESKVNAKFRGSAYTVPLSGTDLPLVQDWCARLAGGLLYRARGAQDTNEPVNGASTAETDVMAEIAGMLAAGAQLDLGRLTDATHAPEALL